MHLLNYQIVINVLLLVRKFKQICYVEVFTVNSPSDWPTEYYIDMVSL